MGNLSRGNYRAGLIGSFFRLILSAIILWLLVADHGQAEAWIFKWKFPPISNFQGNGYHGRTYLNLLQMLRNNNYRELNFHENYCRTNADCPSYKSCMMQTCIDPCPGFCGSGADCQVIYHHPSCTCFHGYTGNPRTECYPMTPGPVLLPRGAWVPSPCEKKIVVGVGVVCTRSDGYDGDPHVDRHPLGYCKIDAGCSDDMACIDHKCEDPCLGSVCRTPAVCTVRAHKPVCVNSSRGTTEIDTTSTTTVIPATIDETTTTAGKKASDKPFLTTRTTTRFIESTRHRETTTKPLHNYAAHAQTLKAAIDQHVPKRIIDVLAGFKHEERVKISEVYKENYSRNVVDDLKSLFSGNSQDFVVAMMTPKTDYFAEEFRKSLAGPGTNEGAVIELLSSLDKHEILRVAEAYKRLNKRTLKDDLVDDTSGVFKDLIVARLPDDRAEAGGRKSSVPSLPCAPVQYIEDPSVLFAERLQYSIAGMGTHEDIITRIIVTRSEIDLDLIENTFNKSHKESLEEWIKGDTSGDYQYAVLHVLRNASKRR